MNLLKAWQDSLEILRPNNFKLFLLVTLNAVWQSCKLMITYFWWLLLAYITAVIVLPILIRTSPSLAMVIITNQMLIYSIVIAVMVCTILLVFAAVLATRPSTKKKDFSYFLSYKKHVAYFFIIGILLFVLVGLLISKIEIVARLWVAITRALAFFNLNHPFGIASVTTFLLFFVDSRATIVNFFYAMWRTIKFFIYNAPFWLIGYYLPKWVLAYIVASIAPYVPSFLLIISPLYLLLPIIIIGYITNFYVKKMHEQRSLYYAE
ncbi:MAG: hypothetical protein M1114_03685 [Candidatus Dependentiae bacterium]|nr:hypothetical protein [Candidatus Dependentiae bacterium]